MKRFAMALALMCVLSTSIIAGEMPTGGKAETPPPQTTTTTSSTASTSSTVLVTVILTILSLR